MGQGRDLLQVLGAYLGLHLRPPRVKSHLVVWLLIVVGQWSGSSELGSPLVVRAGWVMVGADGEHRCSRQYQAGLG